MYANCIVGISTINKLGHILIAFTHMEQVGSRKVPVNSYMYCIFSKSA